jgi:phospholipid/cholesterol/gamma-HCH transport system substrate-binding protein
MTTLKRRLLGVGFLLTVAMLLSLSVLTYQKAFVPVVRVTLKADNAGSQLLRGSDVKLRGIIVGDVREIRTTGDGAIIDLALNKDDVGLIPANVDARLLPKTLFGEKYVDLVLPKSPSSKKIREGAVISQDRSSTAIELERVLDDVIPLLRAIDPEKLSATLNALATAIEGRGEQLGDNLVRLNAYLIELNKEMPTMAADMRQLGTVTDIYADAAPDLLAVLRNLSVTNNTLSEQRTELNAFMTSTTQLADTTRGFLTEHEGRLIQLADVSRPTLELLAKYSPEYPCLLRGLTDFQPLIEEAFGTNFAGLHITLEIVKDNGKYERGDEPAYASKAGPGCRGLPGPPTPYPGVNYADGYDYGKERGHHLPRGLSANLLDGGPADMGFAGTEQEQAVVRPMLAPVMRRPVDEVPDIATLLFAPMARGTSVKVGS